MRVSRTLGVAGLVVAGLFAPVAGTGLPDPLERLAGDAPVRAQSVDPPLMSGTPDPCPTTPSPWTAIGSNCVLEFTACPDDPLTAGAQMQTSVGYFDPYNFNLLQYPGFCEVRAIRSNDLNLFRACRNVTGVIRHIYELQRPSATPGNFVDERVCRLIKPTVCSVGSFYERETCRAVQRRGWSCPAGYVPRNEFNTCYKAPAAPAGANPACGGGAPSLVALSCDEYVDSDFPVDPGDPAWECATKFPTGVAAVQLSANTSSGSSSDYWCEFDATYLKLACHGANPPTAECGTPDMALCLKRVSETGGCTVIAKSIRCRSLQAQYRDGASADAVRADGCRPCLLLPYATPGTSCRGNPNQYISTRALPDWEAAVLRLKEDFRIASGFCQLDPNGNISSLCRGLTACADPPRGQLTWQSGHYAPVAVVNTPVIVTVEGHPQPSKITGGFYVNRDGSFRHYRPGFLAYPGADPTKVDSIITKFSPIDPTAPSVKSIGGFATDQGECGRFKHEATQLRIEELWPDTSEHRTELTELFGSRALDWWNVLPTAEQKRLTEERGLTWWADLTTAAQIDQEAQHRLDTLTHEFVCQAGRPVYLPVKCSWLPTRTGYFKLTAETAWFNTIWFSGPNRDLRDPNDFADINRFLSNPANRQRVSGWLISSGLTAADVGLENTLERLLPHGDLEPPSGPNSIPYIHTRDGRIPSAYIPYADVLYSVRGDWLACSGSLRVVCKNSVTSANYTATDPIGVAVHEVRVATRTPKA